MEGGQQHPLDLLDLTPGYPSTQRLSGRAWTAAWRVATAKLIPQSEPPLQGTLALRAEIADHLRHARGVRCAPGGAGCASRSARPPGHDAVGTGRRAARGARPAKPGPGQHSDFRAGSSGIRVADLRDYSASPGAADAPAGLVFGYAAVSDMALERALEYIRAVTATDAVPRRSVETTWSGFHYRLATRRRSRSISWDPGCQRASRRGLT